MIGLPNIAIGDATSASVFEAKAITFQIGGWPLDALMISLRSAFANRLALLPTGAAPSPVALELGVPVVVKGASSGVQATHGVPASAAMQERQLYDISVRADNGAWHAVAPHAVYYRASWHDFGIAHVTDIHVARRIDYFPGRLEAAGRPGSAQNMANWNDRFRGFIRYANYLHGIGVLDVILATGDIIDYLFEDDDEESGGGNALFARNIILGRAPTERFPDVEELRVPIFMVPGNHDYRKYPYELLFDLDFGLPGNVKQLTNFSGYKMNWHDAVAIQRGDVPSLSAETAAKAIQIDHTNNAFKIYLADETNYVVRLGAHRVVMLDSSHDTDLPSSKLDLIVYALGGLPEGKRNSVGGTPNSLGVSNEMVKLVVDTLAETPADGLFVVGLHAPLFNPWDEDFPYFLRETLRNSQREEVYRWLARQDPVVNPPFGLALSHDQIRQRHPQWFGTDGDPDAVNYVKRGDPGDLLDFGVSSGAAHNLLKAIAGVGQHRRADVVLHGHIHRFADFRLSAANGEIAYHMDFYTQNVLRYYPTRFDKGVTYVQISDDAPASNQPSALPHRTDKYIVTVPPYPKPLATAADPRSWWAEHRPLVLQTEALGPFKNGDAVLGGFRLLSVKNDVIEKIHLVSIETLHAANYRIDWNEVIKPDQPPSITHFNRSREFGLPAAGVPCAFVLPDGTQDVIYRNSAGDIMELYREAGGRRGYGNATGTLAAPKAAGDSTGNPSCYLDTSIGKVVVPYRAADGHVHVLNWGSGAGGSHDALSQSINAPPTASRPIGYFNPVDQLHLIVYRTADGNLQALYWKGAEAARREDLTSGARAMGAVGNPAAYLDTKRGTNIVVYRASDGHIRSIYWSNGPSGLDDLSGFAQAPIAQGDPAAHYMPELDAHRIVYRSAGGRLYDLHCIGTAPVARRDLTAVAGAPPAASDPCLWYNPRGKLKHVVYVGGDGHVYDLRSSGDNAPALVDLSMESVAAPAAGTPFGFSGPTHQHVVYRGKDGEIHEIRWQEADWVLPVVPISDWSVVLPRGFVTHGPTG